MTQATQASPSKIHWPSFWVFFIVTGIAALIFRSENGYEILTSMLKATFSVISTPFILEGFSLVAFGFIVVFANRWFQHRQKSDWVIIPFTEEASQSEDSSEVASKIASIREALAQSQFVEAYRLVKELGTLPSSSEEILLIAETMAKNYKLDEAMDILAIHRGHFPDETAEAQRQDFTSSASQWLSSQHNETSRDLLPRWYQLQLLYSDPSKA